MYLYQKIFYLSISIRQKRIVYLLYLDLQFFKHFNYIFKFVISNNTTKNIALNKVNNPIYFLKFLG